MDFKSIITKINLNLNPYQSYLNFKYTKPFLNIHNKTAKIQEELLLNIIKKNKNTSFGIENDFYEINSIEDYKKRINIVSYENLKKYIDKNKMDNSKKELTSDEIKYYSITTGTTSYPKFIPQTQNCINLRKKAWNIWTNSLFLEKPETFSLFGSILTFTSKPYDGVLNGGVKFGSVSGLIHDIQPKFIKNLYAYPDEILLIDNFHIKYYLILLFSLRKKINLFVTPNPSTLIIYAKKFESHFEDLICDLENNRIEILENDKTIDYNLKKQILKIYKKKKNMNLKIARKLKNIRNKYYGEKIYPKYYFTDIKSIGCWLGGSVGIYVKNLNKYFGENVLIKDIGYIASEGRFSIPIKNEKECGILDIESGFYEFIPINKYKYPIDDNCNKTLLAHELKKGEKYYFVITSENGLYRYFIDDIIEVTGFYNKTPKIKFVQKGKYISSITGEKISEWEVIEAIKNVNKKINFYYHTFFVLANIKNEICNYEYHIEFEKIIDLKNIEEIEKELDLELKKMNIEYKEKRNSQRLDNIKIKILPHNSIINLKHEFSRGCKHDSQIKVPKLIVLEKDKKILEKLKLI